MPNNSASEALIAAAAARDVDGVKKALAAGADVNHMNQLGQTALVDAVILGDGDLVRILLHAGARPDVADFDGITPRAHAHRKGNKEMEALLKDEEDDEGL